MIFSYFLFLDQFPCQVYISVPTLHIIAWGLAREFSFIAFFTILRCLPVTYTSLVLLAFSAAKSLRRQRGFSGIWFLLKSVPSRSVARILIGINSPPADCPNAKGHIHGRGALFCTPVKMPHEKLL